MSVIGNGGVIIVSAIILVVSVAIYAWNVFFKDIPADQIGGDIVSDEAREEARKIIKDKKY